MPAFQEPWILKGVCGGSQSPRDGGQMPKHMGRVPLQDYVEVFPVNDEVIAAGVTYAGFGIWVLLFKLLGEGFSLGYVIGCAQVRFCAVSRRH